MSSGERRLRDPPTGRVMQNDAAALVTRVPSSRSGSSSQRSSDCTVGMRLPAARQRARADAQA